MESQKCTIACTAEYVYCFRIIEEIDKICDEKYGLFDIREWKGKRKLEWRINASKYSLKC